MAGQATLSLMSHPQPYCESNGFNSVTYSQGANYLPSPQLISLQTPRYSVPAINVPQRVLDHTVSVIWMQRRGAGREKGEEEEEKKEEEEEERGEIVSVNHLFTSH